MQKEFENLSLKYLIVISQEWFGKKTILILSYHKYAALLKNP